MRWPEGEVQLRDGSRVLLEPVMLEHTVSLYGSYVYAHTRVDTGDVFYIGKGQARRAWDKARNDAWKAIVRDYGRDVWILISGLSDDDAFEIEQRLVDQFAKGSLTVFARGGKGTLGYRHTPETCAKMSASRTGKPMSTQARKAMSDGIRRSPELLEMRRARFSGENNPAKLKLNREASSNRMKRNNPMVQPESRAKMSAKLRGRTPSAETRAKLSSALLGKKRGPMKQNVRDALEAVREKRKRPVRTACGLTFSSTLEAARSLGIHQGNIVNNCAGRTKSAGGYSWSYDDQLA